MKRIAALLLLIALCISLTACAELFPAPSDGPNLPDIKNITYTKSEVRFSESPDGVDSAFGLVKNMDMTAFGDVTYAFESTVAREDRETCIQYTQAILDRVATGKALQVVIYSPNTYNDTFIQGDTVYTCLQDWQEQEYVCALLYGLFGEYCNYGMLYGYASFLCNELFGTELNVCGADWVYEGQPDALDLSLLCFDISFQTGKDVKAVKKIANTFVSDYIAANSEAAFLQLLIQSGSTGDVAIFVDALSGFYGAMGIDYRPSDYLYRMGGKTFDYILKCPYAVIHVDKDWTDGNAKLVPIYEDSFLHKNYTGTKAYFATKIEEMGQYQTLFALDSYNNDLKIFYTNHYKSGKTACYVPASHSIALPYENSLSLFYIESLVYDCIIQEDWAYAGTLAYFSYYYDYYGNTVSNYEANLESDYESLKYYRVYRERIGRDIDIFVDYVDFTHFYAYTKGYGDPNRGCADSFVGYLVSRFGEEKVIDILCKTHDFGEYTYDGLVADWLLFLEENYSE